MQIVDREKFLAACRNVDLVTELIDAACDMITAACVYSGHQTGPALQALATAGKDLATAVVPFHTAPDASQMRAMNDAQDEVRRSQALVIIGLMSKLTGDANPDDSPSTFGPKPSAN